MPLDRLLWRGPKEQPRSKIFYRKRRNKLVPQIVVSIVGPQTVADTSYNQLLISTTVQTTQMWNGQDGNGNGNGNNARTMAMAIALIPLCAC